MAFVRVGNMTINLDHVQYAVHDAEAEGFHKKGVIVFLKGEEVGMKVLGVSIEEFHTLCNSTGHKVANGV